VERLIRYMMRPPVALDRIEYDEATGVIEIRSRPGSDDEPDGEPQERVEADELVARVIAQVPDPKRGRPGDCRQRRRLRRSGAPRRTPALGRSDPPDLRSGSARLLELRRADEDHRLHYGTQGDPRDPGIDA